jgi:ornithine decarboxylase
MQRAAELTSDALPVYSSPEGMVEVLRPSYPVYCVRPAKIREVAKTFLEGFPGDVLYAVKCNSEPHMLRELYQAGIRHFDTASLPEISLVSEMFKDGQAYFMHPVKSRAAISSAYQAYDVRYYVVDHPSELEKISELIHPDPEVVIVVRVAVRDSGAVYELSSKFGASLKMAIELARCAIRRGYSYGLAFHTGSQCLDPGGYGLGLELVQEVLDNLDRPPTCIDVGGGFPADYMNSRGPHLETYLDAISAAVVRLNLPESCRLLCEPGRGMSAEGESLIAQVQLRKEKSLYLNDGMYGSMIEEKLGLRLPVRMVASRKFSSDLLLYTVYGPTCDSLDVYPAPLELPSDVQEGDWIEFGRIGAYGTACRTRFNGFFPDTFVVVENEFGELN